MDFAKLHCSGEARDGTGHADPYLVIFVADISDPKNIKATTVRTLIFSEMEKGDDAHQSLTVLRPTPIPDPANLIFLVALMESDNGPAQAERVRARVNTFLIPRLQVNAAAGLPRFQIIDHLYLAMNAAIEEARVDRVEDEDDRIGDVIELQLSPSDVHNAREGGLAVVKTLSHTFGSRVAYQSTFVLD
jgi:hypothetical protein